MSWYNEAVFYHIYPLGLLGAPLHNDQGEVVHRLRELDEWITHIDEIGCNAIYIGPLFESVGHGYETTDYRTLDRRLGDNEDLKSFVQKCHDKKIKVIFDGVFNHTGREFFAFKDIQQYRENSRYLDWYHINFWGNNEYNDGFSYENWGGYNIMIKFNQKNHQVQDYICDTVTYWVNEFDVDGLRLDAADVLDFDLMKKLRNHCNQLKPDFWLMGEVIHGDYSRWVNDSTLHSVTNYSLHKALYSAHNDHNYFEIAHTVRRLLNMGNLDLYNFVDNHDVERIHTKLNNKEHYLPAHVLLYTLPGVPSVYYGSEFGIDGHKYRGGMDDEIRPELHLSDFQDCLKNNWYTQICSALGHLRKNNPVLSYGEYIERELTTTIYSFERRLEDTSIYVCVVNNHENHTFRFETDRTYIGLFSGQEYVSAHGWLEVNVDLGEVLVPAGGDLEKIEFTAPIKEEKKEEEVFNSDYTDHSHFKSYEEMSIEELQDCILYKMSRNGPVTDQMLRSVRENCHQGSLMNWVKSFR